VVALTGIVRPPSAESASPALDDSRRANPKIAFHVSRVSSLGANIKKIRVRKGMSQGDICRTLDMDRGYMSAIENGKKNITILQLEWLAQALGVPPDKLLT
jgi:DNA-binding XRE family transcriptional regulator